MGKGHFRVFRIAEIYVASRILNKAGNLFCNNILWTIQDEIISTWLKLHNKLEHELYIALYLKSNQNGGYFNIMIDKLAHYEQYFNNLDRCLCSTCPTCCFTH